MNSASQSQPTLFQRILKRWGGLAWWKQGLLLVLAAVGLLIFLVAYRLFGWFPGPSVSGVVVDQATGQPVADAFVVVNIKVTGFGLVHGVTGCSAGSGLVMTDSKGEFAYSVAGRDAFRLANPASWFIDIGVYHPDYSMPAPAEHRQRNSEAWSKRVELRSPRIELVPKSTLAAQRFLEIDGSFGSGCVGWSRVFDPAPLYRAMYLEHWQMICGQASDPTVVDGVMMSQATRAMENNLRLLEGPFPRIDTGVYEESWRMTYVWKTLLRDFSRVRSAPDYGRPLTAQERAAVCEFYAPPIDNVLIKEKPL